jgi:hypothetical protein
MKGIRQSHVKEEEKKKSIVCNKRVLPHFQIGLHYVFSIFKHIWSLLHSHQQQLSSCLCYWELSSMVSITSSCLCLDMSPPSQQIYFVIAVFWLSVSRHCHHLQTVTLCFIAAPTSSTPCQGLTSLFHTLQAIFARLSWLLQISPINWVPKLVNIMTCSSFSSLMGLSNTWALPVTNQLSFTRLIISTPHYSCTVLGFLSPQ